MTHYLLPNGDTVEMTVRPGTNDHNVCYSILTEDEYRIPRDLTGTALDVGAHIGAATVALCALNPELRVVAVEALPANIELLRKNTAPYADRVTILEAAAGTNPNIRWNGEDQVHRFIGNMNGTGGETYTGDTVSLSEIVAEYGRISFLKIDCEGCEETFLDDPAIRGVESVVGEWHSGPSVEIRFTTGYSLDLDRRFKALDLSGGAA